MAPRLEPAWPGQPGFLESAMWQVFTSLEKSHINIVGDFYANKDKSWSLKPGENPLYKGLKAMGKSK